MNIINKIVDKFLDKLSWQVASIIIPSLDTQAIGDSPERNSNFKFKHFGETTHVIINKDTGDFDFYRLSGSSKRLIKLESSKGRSKDELDALKSLIRYAISLKSYYESEAKRARLFEIECMSRSFFDEKKRRVAYEYKHDIHEGYIYGNKIKKRVCAWGS